MYTDAELGFDMPSGRAWACDDWDQEEAALQLSLLEKPQQEKLACQLITHHRHLLTDEYLWEVAESAEQGAKQNTQVDTLIAHVLTPDEDGNFPHPDSQKMMGLILLQTAFPVQDHAVSRSRVEQFDLSYAPKWALRPLWLYSQAERHPWTAYRERTDRWSMSEVALIEDTYDQLGSYDKEQTRNALGDYLSGHLSSHFPLPWVAAAQQYFEMRDGRPFPLPNGFTDERLGREQPALVGFPWEMASRALTRMEADKSWFEPVPEDVYARLRAVKRRLEEPGDKPVQADRRNPRDWFGF